MVEVRVFIILGLIYACASLFLIIVMEEENSELNPRLMKQMSAMLDEKISGLKRSLVAEQSAMTAKIEKKLKTTEKKFKSKSSRCQYELNVEMREKFEDVQDQVKRRTAESIDKAADILEEGMAMIDRRNKHIEIADWSEYGWATVEEYEKRALASDSDDDKRMRKAEKAEENVKRVEREKRIGKT